MVIREKKFYTEEFKEQVLTAYFNSEESVSSIAARFHVNHYTVGGWVYRKKNGSVSKKSVKFVPTDMDLMEKSSLSPEAMSSRIIELEKQLAAEKMRSHCLDRMIDIAERELKIDIRKKSGARQSMR
jgi:transposase-like protein